MPFEKQEPMQEGNVKEDLKENKKEEGGCVMETMEPSEIVDALFNLDEEKKMEIFRLIVEKLGAEGEKPKQELKQGEESKQSGDEKKSFFEGMFM